MSLQKLDIYNVRNLQHVSLQPSPGLNFIVGNNASGKTSLLEAVFILGRARSFRTQHIKQAVRFDQNEMIVAAKSVQKNGHLSQLGIRYDGRDFEIRINQQSNQARDQLAHALPIQLIDPKSYRLLDAGPQLRREFIDWGAFNSYENFLPAWRQFKTALKQRNALLKVKRPEHIEVWNKELVNYGTIVADLRSRYIQDLDDVFQAIIGQFLQLNAIEFSLYPGWQHDKGLLASLNDDLEKDLRYGFTHSGPHRCELTILADGLPAKDYVSRGQLKLLVLGLKLAQIKVLQQKNDNGGCLLIDDFTAELDASNRSKLLNYLGTIGFQVFITATELQEFGDIASYSNCKVFHVEQGQVKHDECFT